MRWAPLGPVRQCCTGRLAARGTQCIDRHPTETTLSATAILPQHIRQVRATFGHPPSLPQQSRCGGRRLRRLVVLHTLTAAASNCPAAMSVCGFMRPSRATNLSGTISSRLL